MSGNGAISPKTKKYLTRDDAAFLEGLGWRDVAVPPIENSAECAAYRRMEQALRKGIADLSYAARGASTEGKLSAALGARIADWVDQLTAPED